MRVVYKAHQGRHQERPPEVVEGEAYQENVIQAKRVARSATATLLQGPCLSSNRWLRSCDPSNSNNFGNVNYNNGNPNNNNASNSRAVFP